jgi:hypothetical protein
LTHDIVSRQDEHDHMRLPSFSGISSIADGKPAAKADGVRAAINLSGAEELITQADQGLYAAKGGGGDVRRTGSA